jgi:hypothetical protein
LLNLVACGRKPSAGLGGNATLVIKPVHHGLPIDSCKVYVKFNSKEAVTIDQYDLSMRVAKNYLMIPVAVFENLKKGDYYIYGEGWDPSIFSYVKGGMPYTISEEKEIELLLPVTEQH